MSELVSVNLLDMAEAVGDERVQELLSSYCCPRNLDIESFARRKALEFAKQGIARTHLVFQDDGQPKLAGFYALTVKVLSVPTSGLSSTTRRRLCRFGLENERTGTIDLAAPLIAQLGRNYAATAGVVSGNELLGIACRKVAAIQRDLGGKLVYLECEPSPGLVAFYERNGFRQAQPDESPDGLIQMIRFLG